MRLVIRQFPDVFATVAYALGVVQGVECDINTGDVSPIHVNRWRYTLKQVVVIKEHLRGMLQNGIIQPRKGVWRFPVVLVRKQSSKWQFRADFRKLNNVTIRDVYPNPRIDESLDTLNAAKLYSVVDCLWWHWNVPIKDSVEDKIPISTKFELYRFRRMPFGFANTPALFQSLMDIVLHGLL